MRNGLPKRFANNLVEKPTNLTTRGDMEKYDDLAETLKVIESTKAVMLDVEEAAVLFGKHFRTTVVQQMKKRDIRKPKINVKGNTVYIWNTRV